MANYLRSAAITVLFCSMAVPVRAQQYYLYEPKPVPSATAVKDGSGVLVKEVPVQAGNTLYGISRKFSGHGMYYPQILLFNNIKDPNLIHAGDTLKIPLPKGDVPSGKADSRPIKKEGKSATRGGDKHPSTAAVKKRPVVKAAASVASPAGVTDASISKVDRNKTVRRPGSGNSAPAAEQSPLPGDSAITKIGEISATGNTSAEVKKTAVASAAGQQIYEKAVKAYRQEDYRTALDLFDRYINENPDSMLTADASLYKAECYLKLSAQ